MVGKTTDSQGDIGPAELAASRVWILAWKPPGLKTASMGPGVGSVSGAGCRELESGDQGDSECAAPCLLAQAPIPSPSPSSTPLPY